MQTVDIETAFDTYISLLLEGDRNGCKAVIEQLLWDKYPVKTLYQEVFQKSLYHVGELWEQNKISIAREQVATSITESLLTLVFPDICSPSCNGKKVVVACTENELHQLGARMVADFLEMNGWDSHFLGSNTSADKLIHVLLNKKPDLLCLSLSVLDHLPQLLDTISKVRKHFSKLPIAVGGQAFLWGGKEELMAYNHVSYVSSLDQLEAMTGL